MPITELSSFTLGPLTLFYHWDEATRLVSFSLLPTAAVGRRVPHRGLLDDTPEYAGVKQNNWLYYGQSHVDPLIHCKLEHHPYSSGFSQGRSLHAHPSPHPARYARQEVLKDGATTRVITHLASDEGYRWRHGVSWRADDPAVEVETVFENPTGAPVTLELLSSFALGRISPFAADDAPDRLILHRARSFWSSEGRLESLPLETLHLERSWAALGVAERFGQVGSMPVRGFFPFSAIEDREARVFWGAQLACAGSWQMEIHRFDDNVNLSGGLADHELGHWKKTVQPGETFTAPRAIVSAVEGDMDDLCHALTRLQERPLKQLPAVEKDLPVVCNEWCTSWGKPSHLGLVRLARRLKDTGVRYLVIDSGWYVPEQEGAYWGNCHGDWTPNARLFPHGLKAAADAIRAEGLIPGLWFELETLGPLSDAWNRTDHLLQRNGLPIQVGERRFWDFRDPWVIDYLTGKVIDQLKSGGFGYVKVDYNETLGIGADGTESQGETLRQHLEGVRGFFRKMREALPNLVIEVCSSGGHRLEPSMVELGSMASFSDAHECLEIPIIAANVQRHILPCQSQIWAVLRPYDDAHRLVYSLAAAFLGRLCLSGDLFDLTDAQWTIVKKAQALYTQAAPLIRHGKSRRLGPTVTSYRHPKGWQAVCRLSDDESSALVVAHTFAKPFPKLLEIPLPPTQATWTPDGALTSGRAAPSVRDGTLRIPSGGEFRGMAVILRKR
ncbi:MAG: alpha-galactosidase [Lentisphaerae bacterium]|nr:alpha-galactosidase [Lentisphaerota bacterium]